MVRPREGITHKIYTQDPHFIGSHAHGNVTFGVDLNAAPEVVLGPAPFSIGGEVPHLPSDSNGLSTCTPPSNLLRHRADPSSSYSALATHIDHHLPALSQSQANWHPQLHLSLNLVIVCVPFSSLKPIFQARTVSDAPPFDPSNIVSLQLMFSKFEFDGKLNPTFVEGAFKLPLSSIRAYLKEPITPRFVHLGSAGATRLTGLDLI
ncbi:uncharacterized protein LOC109950398 [Prunus persica]|uniref:uncharacterized protein LOC109950398 n=1 Tax=Prunus persica TaxID=3760 RepID=UPI0009AB61AC|nr:uncharacterized protein LOC109950398 [Prunus persica]